MRSAAVLPCHVGDDRAERSVVEVLRSLVLHRPLRRHLLSPAEEKPTGVILTFGKLFPGIEHVRH